MQTSQPGVLPLRPLTVGELLDASVTLLRTRGPLLIGLGAAAAVLEQAVLFPLRRLANVDIWNFPVGEDRWRAWALLIVVGFATEAAIIGGLAFPAASAAPKAVLGNAAPRPEPVARPLFVTIFIALVAALGCGLVVATSYLWPATYFLAAFITIPIWIWLYGSLGLAVPAAVIERLDPVRAIGRSFALSVRGFLRTLRVRVLAYLSWFLIRVAWGWGVIAVVDLVYTPPSNTGDNLLMAVIYLAVNMVAYPTLACLDAVLYLEARMRSEGLDIALRRSLHRRTDPAPVLVGSW
ncbi:MAG TPA: hypothetical protein VIL37_12095 [Natronosporangium sp.]